MEKNHKKEIPLPKNNQGRKIATFVLVGIVIAAFLLPTVWNAISSFNAKTPSPVHHQPTQINEPVFKKEGVLTFSSGGKEIRTIDIEIADNDYERMLGLMHRKSMSDTRGMLFKFDREEPQSFWMKDTHISLDIIYVGQNKQIVSIQKNAVPFSEKSLPSEGPAQYVVEVIGGFCDQYGIKAGDTVVF